jgi:amino acid adenylation domain-containing protein
MKKLLKNLRENNIVLDLEDGDLRVFASGSVPDAALIAEIKERKAELIQFLSSNHQGNFKESFQVSIPAAPVQPSYPLSSAQRRLWVLSRFGNGNVAYNVQGVFTFEGRLDQQGLSYAFNNLVSRHESLRTVFRQDETGEVRQFIKKPEEAGFKITFRDARKQENQQAFINELVQREAETPFDLGAGSLLRVLVCQVEEEKHVFSYVMHHIISDGWSMGILVRELLLFYNSYSDKLPARLEPLRIHYKDYAAWQQEQLSGESLQQHQSYWLKQLDGELPVLELPGVNVRPSVKTYNGDSIVSKIDASAGRELKALTHAQGSTLFMGLLAAVNALLYRYTGQEDIIIGTSIASREHTDLENQIGFYVNTLALRTKFNGENSYEELVNNVKDVTVGAYEHQAYPFDELVNALNLGRDMSRSPVFDVMVVLQQVKAPESNGPAGLAHIIVSPYEASTQTISKFDLTFFFTEVDDEIIVNIQYNRDIYSRSMMEQLAGHLTQLISAVTLSPGTPLNRIDYISSEERTLLEKFSHSIAEYPAHKTIVDLFEEQVKRTPLETAVAFGEKSLTYEQLNAKANKLANYLRNECGVGPDDVAGIMLDRSENMIVALLGILKSGGAYVAIDPENPRARKEFIINDTAIKALVTQTDYLFDLEYYSGNIFAIDIQMDALEDASTPVAINKPADLAYVIYTSGSTGQPKGVMIAHQSLVDYSYGILQRTNMRDCKSFGLVSTIAADLGNTIIYTSLLIGGELHVFTSADVTNAARMMKADLDCIKIVPSHWKALQQENELFAPAKCLVFGGEQLTYDVIALLKKHNAGCNVYNHYGPSEATIGKLTRPIDINAANPVISLGSPFCNSTLYVLDAQRRLLPVGVPGEIYIGGDGLARGYLNNPALTAEKFVADPFKNGARLYKTGDQGKWLPDGTIEFIGRKDDQVKIRGYRIELGEIESALKAHASVQAATVAAKTNGAGEKEVVAYIVPAPSFSKDELKSYLNNILPSYMLPAHFVELEKLPLTANGKINRKALPDPAGLETGTAYLAPRTVTEHKLVALWQEVLGRERVGVKDNFFELGGHSLRATRLSTQIHKEFEVELGLKELFETVVLEDQAQLIDNAAKTSFNSIQPVKEQADYVLSSSQRRLWVLSQFEDGNAAYNVPAVYVFEGELDRAAFERSFKALLQRHESLRTVFKQNDNKEVRQHIKSVDEIGFVIGYRDVRDENAQDELVRELVHEEFVKKFDLATGPLVRINLFQVEDKKWVLTYVMHHIISDGWSKSILINELLSLYNSFVKGEENPLRPLRIQYKDYAAWQHGQLSGELLEAHRSFWLQHFEGTLPVVGLPSAKTRPALKTYSGEALSRRVDRQLSTGIKQISQQQGGSLFMGILAAVNALFYRYTGLDDIILGTPVAGREHADLQDQIGFYANTLALRTQFSGQHTYRQLLGKVKQSTLGAYEHQIYPFDTLVNELNIQRDMSRNPLFDIQVIVESAVDNIAGEKGLSNITVSTYDGAQTPASVFDLVLFFVETADALLINAVYNNDVYDKRSIEQLTVHIEQMLAAIIASPDEAIGKLEYLQEQDKHKLLSEFNSNAFEYAAGSTIIDLFKQQAEARPDATALTYGSSQLSYRELDEQSDNLAAYLRKTYNLQQEQMVGVMLERSEKLVVALLAILKAGGVYVPVDPEYPRARKEFIIGDTAIEILITQTEYIFELDYYSKNIFAIDVELDDLKAEENVSAASPQQLAYVIYTSGSTGQPKGVMIEHAALSASIQSQRTIFNIAPGTRCLQFTSSSFDVSVFEIFIALASGGSLYIIEEQRKKDPALLENYISSNNIEVASIPPAYLRLLRVDNIRSLRKLITGGEAASYETVRAFSKEGTYYNAYGPTESSLCASVFETNAHTQFVSGSVPIGKPIPGVEIYVVDENANLVAIGVAGEIYIGGVGLARGYHNNAGLSAEKFVANPFRKGEKMYRTGDTGRWLPDGNLEFTGRVDDQVKVHGYRIEPGEVEKAVQSHPEVTSAVVVAKQDKNGDRQLVAYIVGNDEVKSSDLLSYLSKTLPAYMLPAHFVQLEELPLTSNGKVDKKKLPDPEGIGMESGVEYVAPRTDAERKMVKIWEELLGRENIGIRESFFELGGDSIKILRMTTELKKDLGLDIPITDIYKNNTIENILLHASVNKQQIDERNRKVKEKETIVKAEIEALKQRILLSGILSDTDNIEDIYPMSDVEKGMVYESLRNEKLCIYHDQMVQRKLFDGFDIEKFRLAVKLIAQKHSILRTAFLLEEFETEVQVVYKEIGDVVFYKDLTGVQREEQEREVRDFMKGELNNPFRFAQAPLWRMNIYNFGNNEIVFVFQTHHAIIDGWSDASFITELHNTYLKLVQDASFKPELLKASYKDFIIQHEIDKRVDEVKDFWKNELAGFTRADLFTSENDFKIYSQFLDAATYKKLEKTAASLNTTIKVISLSAYLCMLKVLNYENEVLAGLVTNNRPNCEDGDKILGCFLNTIPLRMQVDGNETCAQLVTRVHRKIIELKNYEGLSVLEIAQALGSQANSGNPFFDMIFSYVDFHSYNEIIEDAKPAEKVVDLPPLNVSNYGRTNTYFDFSVNVTGGRYSAGLKFTKKLRAGISAEKAGQLYFRILNYIVDKTSQPLRGLEVVSENERQQLLTGFNNTTIAYPRNKSIVQLFEEQVAATPGNIALVFEGKFYTYSQINEKANRFAHYLRANYRVNAGDLVGVMIERSQWPVIFMLGILKTGAAYVPIDPDYPQDRVSYMLSDSNCKLVISNADLEKFRNKEESYPVSNPRITSTPESLAYVMYTSGSTGGAKGVLIDHRNIVRLVKNTNYVEVKEDDCILSLSNFVFDGSTFDIYAAFLNGAKLVVTRKEVFFDTDALNEVIGKNNVTMFFITTALFNTLSDSNISFAGVKRIFFGGEMVSVPHVRQFMEKNSHVDLYHVYGPTENTTFSTWHKINAADTASHTIPIGSAIANTKVYVLNADNNLSPIGIPGEICVSGDGLAKGYLNQPGLTAEKFVANPFEEGALMYRTGDFGRWLPGGAIEILGRKDDQVKIRGFRIELGEIEAALQKDEQVKAAVVIARAGRQGGKELIAYVVINDTEETSSKIRARLAKALPAYMLPDYFVQMQELPLTINGKVDKKQLPQPEELAVESGVEYVAPQNETEERLATIWQDILGVEKIGIKENFFECGGHSLKAMKLLARVHREFNVKLKLEDMFNNSSIEEMSKELIRRTWVNKGRQEQGSELISDESFIL